MILAQGCGSVKAKNSVMLALSSQSAAVAEDIQDTLGAVTGFNPLTTVARQVLIDAHMVGAQETGNETYVASLLQQDAVFGHHGFRLFALMKEAHPEIFPSERTVVEPFCDRQNMRRFFWQMPRAIARTRATLLHVSYHAPFWVQTPIVVAIHDVSYRVRPRFVTLRNYVIPNTLGYMTARRSKAVLTPSKFSRAEILRIYPWLEQRLFVTPYAAGPQFYVRQHDEVERVTQKLGIHAPYFLFVGAAQPRKNVQRVVEAFLRVAQQHPGCQMIFAGRWTRTLSRLQVTYSDAFESKRIMVMGYLSDDELSCLYTGCVGFVFPSLYEGFGIPVMEAMQCGAPVITSNTSCLPEVAGDAALLVDPTATEQIADAMRKILENPSLRESLVQRGFLRARQFTWQATASATAQAYEAALELSTRGLKQR